jgi:hypothetical protein
MAMFFRLLTAATLAIHLLVGCCAHHAHAASAASPRHETNVDACCGHHEQSGDSHSERHGCENEKCSFLRSSDDSPAKFVFQVHRPSVALWHDASVPRLPGIQAAGIFPADDLFPPLRLHLAHQVLLI